MPDERLLIAFFSSSAESLVLIMTSLYPCTETAFSMHSINCAKTGFEISGTTKPIIILFPVFKTCAAASGVYPSSLMASRTRFAVSSETKRVLLITWDTVDTDTPARLATSVIFVLISTSFSHYDIHFSQRQRNLCESVSVRSRASP